MKLSEVDPKTLPSNAGLATLKFSKRIKYIERQGDTIQIPLRKGVEFYLLHDGTQFLIREITQKCHHCGQLMPRPQPGIFFGGTDQKTIFLTRMLDDAFSAFQHGGEARFYKALKPPLIRACEATWGDHTQRQGDIFAYALPLTWEELIQRAKKRICHFTISLLRQGCSVSTHLFGTRHLLAGMQGGFDACILEKIPTPQQWGWMTVVEGIIEAPDHDPLIVEGGPHLLGQTFYLHEPRSAD